jgi:hypothetical protein
MIIPQQLRTLLITLSPSSSKLRSLSFWCFWSATPRPCPTLLTLTTPSLPVPPHLRRRPRQSQHTLAHAFVLGWKDPSGSTKNMTSDVARKNPALAEQLTRAYYAIYSVCPPLFPDGLRLDNRKAPDGSAYDDDELPDNWAEHVKASRVYRHSDKKGKPWVWARALEGEALRTARLATYDSAMRDVDSTTITTLWEDDTKDTQRDRAESSRVIESDSDDPGYQGKGKATAKTIPLNGAQQVRRSRSMSSPLQVNHLSQKAFSRHQVVDSPSPPPRPVPTRPRSPARAAPLQHKLPGRLLLLPRPAVRPASPLHPTSSEHTREKRQRQNSITPSLASSHDGGHPELVALKVERLRQQIAYEKRLFEVQLAPAAAVSQAAPKVRSLLSSVTSSRRSQAYL